jgi:hypothetical protein
VTDKHLPLYIFPSGQTNISPYISFLWDRQTSPPIYLSFVTDKHLPLYIFPLRQTNISPYIFFLWDRQISPQYIGGDVCLSQRKDI